MSFEAAERIATAVLYEGYLLYPYRFSSTKNRFRWQYGVVAPRDYARRDGSESWEMQTECLIEPRQGSSVDIRVRFLQLLLPERPERAEPEDAFGREEPVERVFEQQGIRLEALLAGEQTFPLDGAFEREAGSGPAYYGRPIQAVVRLSGEKVEAETDLIRLRVRIENLTRDPELAGAGRSRALEQSLIGTHTLIALRDGDFVSIMDPPPHFAQAAAGCRNQNTWPVLAGDPGSRNLILSAPIILYDYPQVAPESPGDLFDSTEIDELLMLRTLTLTSQEKEEARADRRAREIIERSEGLGPEMQEKLHGAIRYLRKGRASKSEPEGSQ